MKTLQIAIVSAASILFGLFVWWLVAYLKLANPMLLPGPASVAAAVWEMIADGTLIRHLAISFARALGGFAIAAAVGVPAGILIARFKWVGAALNPWVELLRPVPPIAFLPLAVLWFGIGETSKVIVISYGAVFPILLNTIHGVRAIDNSLLRAARALGASSRQVFIYVVLPAATPSVVTGLRLGAGMAIFVLVAAELIGASSGLGWLITDAREHFLTDHIMVGIVTLGLLGWAINRALLALESRLIKWRPPSEDS
ncbi:MAG TPA: ABC transporter permease [Ramlibacter sp.]|uniref:ABC transporter permease n=1 Tax=Ramlibacter sp. TaxID=1917967 RepID=UPI002CBF5E0A|nr:ABC transporter permease [Ramlibacter sp.]HVZ46345.1 ABC transporter permease [Ramlibacter sp.]